MTIPLTRPPKAVLKTHTEAPGTQKLEPSRTPWGVREVSNQRSRFCCVFNVAVGPQSHSPEQYYCSKFVAVGTAIARRPPHRSQRAALPHWAPTSGHDAKPHIREWMSQARGRQPAIDQALHSPPWHPAILAPPPKHAMPVPYDMIVE